MITAGKKPSPRDLSSYVVGTNGFVLGPQGGLRVSVLELFELMKLHMSNGVWNGIRLINHQTMELMHSAAWVYNGNNGDTMSGLIYNYGLATHICTGLKKDVVLPGMPMWGHTGFAYGLASSFFYNDERHYGIIIATNGAMDNFNPRYNSTGFNPFEYEIFQTLDKYFF